MTVSNNLGYILNSVYIDNYPSNPIARRSYIGNNGFSWFIRVKRDNDNFEAPLIISHSVFDSIFRSNGKDIIVPINIHNRIVSARGVSAALRYGGFNNNGFLTNIFIKSLGYYIGKGVILDNDMNPLIICSVSGKRVPNSDIKYEPNSLKIKMYVHPRIFNQETIMDKFIVKTMIPYYLSAPLATCFRVESLDVNVVIEDVNNNLTIKPLDPDKAALNNITIKDYMLSNIDSVIGRLLRK